MPLSDGDIRIVSLIVALAGSDSVERRADFRLSIVGIFEFAHVETVGKDADSDDGIDEDLVSGVKMTGERRASSGEGHMSMNLSVRRYSRSC